MENDLNPTSVIQVVNNPLNLINHTSLMQNKSVRKIPQTQHKCGIITLTSPNCSMKIPTSPTTLPNKYSPNISIVCVEIIIAYMLVDEDEKPNPNSHCAKIVNPKPKPFY